MIESKSADPLKEFLNRSDRSYSKLYKEISDWVSQLTMKDPNWKFWASFVFIYLCTCLCVVGFGDPDMAFMPILEYLLKGVIVIRLSKTQNQPATYHPSHPPKSEI